MVLVRVMLGLGDPLGNCVCCPATQTIRTLTLATRRASGNRPDAALAAASENEHRSDLMRVCVSNQAVCPETATAQAQPTVSGKVLSFGIGDAEYAIELERVREIVGLVDLHPLPGAPQPLRGTLALRKRAAPVMCLRRRLGLAEAAPTEQTCIVVIDVGADIGLIVDRVLGITRCRPRSANRSPSAATRVPSAANFKSATPRSCCSISISSCPISCGRTCTQT